MFITWFSTLLFEVLSKIGEIGHKQDAAALQACHRPQSSACLYYF